MRPEHRLRATHDVRDVVRDGRSVAGPWFVLYHLPGHARPRVGFSTNRRIGGAVTRNRVKRLLREAMRPLIPRLVDADVVIAARPSIVGAELADLREALTAAAAKAELLRRTEEGTPT